MARSSAKSARIEAHPPAAPAGAGGAREHIALAIPLALTLVAYLPSLRNGFVYDDAYMIAGNRYIGQWSFIWKSFVRDVWWFADPLRLPKSFYYRPLENTWLALNYHLFGTNPIGWHASMIAVQLVGVWLVFLLARELTRNRVAAAIAAVLYGLIPVHAGAISWGRSIPLPMSAEFQMGALACFIGRARAPRRALAFALILYAAALLSHESAVVFPVIVAMYVFLLEDAPKAAVDVAHALAAQRVSASIRATAPFAALIVIYAAIRLWVFGIHLPVSERNAWSALECVLTIPGALGQYALLLALPWRAGPAHELDPASDVASATFWLPALALAAAGLGAWLLLRRQPHRRLYLFCGGWLLVALAPFLNLASLNPVEAIQDRYLFAASAPWCIFLGDIAAGLIAAGGAHAWAASAAAAAIALVYAGTLWRIEPYWHDNLTYFSKCIEMYPSSWLCHGDLGLELEHRGDLRGAEREILISLPLRPNDGLGLYNLAVVHMRMGELGRAQEEMERALKSMKNPSAAHYVELAEVADANGDRATVERALELAGSTAEGPVPAAVERAKLDIRHGDYRGAEAALRPLLPEHRENSDVWLYLALAAGAQGRDAEALADLDAALRIDPDRARLHVARGATLSDLGRRDEALAECSRALALDPGNRDAEALLADLTGARQK